MILNSIAIGLLLLAHSFLAQATQTETTSRRGDNSDWWSGDNLPASYTSTTVQHRGVASSNFDVLGIHLTETMFSKAAGKLGAASIIDRGDASTGRHQACYVSSQGANKVYLIFEQSEVDFTYYLFVGGPDWDGSDLCVRTNLVSRQLAIASGIQLGQTPTQVIAILGRPNQHRDNALIYSFSLKIKTSAEDLRRMRAANSQMSDKDFHANYDYFNWGAGFVAKFVKSKLTYFLASTGGTY